MTSNMSTFFKAMNQKQPIDITLEHWQMVKEILEKNVLAYDVKGRKIRTFSYPYSSQ